MPDAVAASLTVILSIDPFLFHCWLVMFLLAFNGIKWCYTCNSTLPCLFFNVSVFPDSKIIPQLLPNLKESPLNYILICNNHVNKMWTQNAWHSATLLPGDPQCLQQSLWQPAWSLHHQRNYSEHNTKKLNYHFWNFHYLVFILMRDEIIIKPSLGIKQLEC